MLVELAEKVALVLVRINPFKNPVHSPVTLCCKGFFTTVVSCGHQVCTMIQGGVKECVEFYLTIAKYVGVGGAASGILIEHIVNHPPPIFFTQVNEIEWDVQFPGYHFGNHPVLFPFALSVECALSLMPVLHEHAEYVISLLFQKQSGDT